MPDEKQLAYQEPYPHGLELYDSFDYKKLGRAARKIPIGISEEKGEPVETELTDAHILKSYGKESYPKQAKGKVEPATYENTHDVATPYEELDTEGFPKKASWHSQYNGVVEAEVLGKLKDQDAYTIVTNNEVNGTKSHLVPLSELDIYPDSAPNSEPKNEIDKLRDEFEARFKEMEERFAAREKELLDEIKDLKEQLAKAKGQPVPTDDADTLAVRRTPEKDITEEFPMGSKVTYLDVEDGQMKEGNVAGHEKDHGEQFVQVTHSRGNGGAYLWFRPEDLREWNNMPQPGQPADGGSNGNTNPTDTAEFNPDDYEWEPFPGEYAYVKVGDDYEGGWQIISVYKDNEDVLRVKARKDGQEVDEPYEVFLLWQVEGGGVDEADDQPDPQEPVEVVDEPTDKPRWWTRIRDRYKKYTGRGVLAYWQSRGARTIITEEELVEGRRGFGVGALALVGALGVGAGYLIDLLEDIGEKKHGIPKANIGNTIKHLNLDGIAPNTIHAQTPNQFQHGVLNLLEGQGVHAHGVTQDKIDHMNNWMQAHGIASGMKEGHHGLEQNVVNFPNGSHEFANANMPGSDQGFTLGKDGTGRAALDQWVRESEKIGITYSRS
jgi:hypothetical protein